MSTPYTPGQPTGGPGYAPPVVEPATQNYAADYSSEHSGAMGTPLTDQGRPDVEGNSVGALIGEVTKDLSTLMRQELELAKVEMKAEAKKAGQGAGMFGAAGFAGYMVALFLSLALMWALASAIPTGWSALIVAALWGIVGAIAFVLGRKKFQQVNPKPERTVDTLSKVPGALKPN
ncbi:phage holin family protein [Blastococcus sp. TML/M2B]|uniref:phage holin family protein n=1 Tax=unclassified Blastococcus TaxID=2619396 RepID=UPI00190DC5DB|nr:MULTISPECIES: phage holin family protein [unclassified Blastococcus]MBN1091883.1 phage holin family protein [Blastococcus sp. TML/M2B]MBN1098011.1 phage holin family protein [Blastococcus sp. TML/C7B]